MLKIYLACPYTHKDPTIVEWRVEYATKQAGYLMKAGHLVFSPLTHCHPIAELVSLPTNFDFWKVHNFSFIDWADEVYVIQVMGWHNSVGVKAEIQYAVSQTKPVRYI